MTGFFEGALCPYVALFILAATPWIELLFVVPLGIAMGLEPVPVAAVVFTGNAFPVFLIVFGYDRWRAFRAKASVDDKSRREGRRQARALRIWNTYGLPGLAMAAPLLTGIHLATIMALFFNPDRRKLLLWMTLSLLIWTAGMTIVCYGGVEALRYLTVRS